MELEGTTELKYEGTISDSLLVEKKWSARREELENHKQGRSRIQLAASFKCQAKSLAVACLKGEG